MSSPTSAGADAMLSTQGCEKPRISVTYEPCTLLHLGDQVLVEHALSLLVERAVDGDDITLSEHLLEGVDTAAADLLLLLG